MEVSRRRYAFDRRQEKLELVQSAEWQAMSVQKRGRSFWGERGGTPFHDKVCFAGQVELIGMCRRSCQS